MPYNHQQHDSTPFLDTVMCEGYTDLTPLARDYQYLTPVIKEVEAERTEREDLESMVITKRKNSAKNSTKH